MPFDPTRPIELVEAPVAQVTSDQARLDSARQRGIALFKESSLFSGFPQPHANYYKDFAGTETSKYDFDHVTFLLNFLQEPKFSNLYFRLDDGIYDATNATWNLVRATPMKFPAGVAAPPASASLAELKAALAARIRELAISEVLLAEWMAISHSIADDQVFYRLPFSEKMQTFRQESL